ncbi:MAG: glutathione S-transferase, partial [Alphaproteobacteria bacterium]|nr:glutathione S-transferase [Alphaproteobacteria bacterium]
MKLFHSPTSPYVRKVDVLARETGLSAKIEIVPATVSPVKRDEAVSARNPLGKVPTLLLGDGTALYDSRVICEYLDSLHDGKKYFPPSGPERWKTLTLLSLADGILDAALLARYEEFLRPPEAR